MEPEHYLEQLKKEYQKVLPPQRLLEQGWLELRRRIDVESKPTFTPKPIFSRWLTFPVGITFLLIVTLLGLAQVAQGALPGEPLYPVKRLSENVISAVTPNKQIKVERRAQEIIDLTRKKKDSELLKETVKQYEQTVIETKQEFKKKGKGKEEFDENLEKQEKRFKEVAEHASQSTEEEIKKAIEASREGRNGNNNGQNGEVKGVEEEQREGGAKQEESNSEQQGEKKQEERKSEGRHN